ncbi:pathogenesis-related protein PRB1-3-like [Aristolochia californica]|uniref:pathogenesis-related protein PRB1-3-like n=1 Tax=Aristolochia californica TaxID=171875 RepID=UPI0035E2C1EA
MSKVNRSHPGENVIKLAFVRGRVKTKMARNSGLLLLAFFLSSCLLFVFVVSDPGLNDSLMAPSLQRTRDGNAFLAQSLKRNEVSSVPVAAENPAGVVPTPSNVTDRPRRGKLAREFLSAHNIVRQQLNLPPLTWNRRLARFARNWAAKLAVEDCSRPRHSDGPYGENTFWGSGPDWKPADAVKAWVEELTFYDMKDNFCKLGADCGHYTQMIWRTSQKLGCESVLCQSGNTFIICNYDPPGNYVGEGPFDLPHSM